METDAAPKLPTVRLLDFLLDLANRAGIPPKAPENELWTTKLFSVVAQREYADGEVRDEVWEVAVFYDGGEFDYIEYFATPEGKEVDWFDFPWHSEEYQTFWNWRPTSVS